MDKPQIDKYFEKLGISVIYNCLGYNEELIGSFVHENNSILKHYGIKSNNYKHELYDKVYSLTKRHKKTGFELFENLDRKIRNNFSSKIKRPQFSPTIILEKEHIKYYGNYKTKLKEFVSSIENPLLYYSGGMDSELVAKSFLELDKNFKMVIFEWLDNDKKIINSYDLKYAYSFCNANNIIPIIKQVNIEELWQSDYFKKLAVDLEIVSPQIVTHAYCILLMSKEFKNCTHVFGGEIRFQKYLMDNGDLANLVFLDKVTPAYNGQTYVADSYGTCDYSLLQLGYNTGDGTWAVYADYQSLTGVVLASGVWTTTPGSLYQYRVTNVVTYPIIGSNAGVVGPEGPYPTDWFTIGIGFIHNLVGLYQINAGFNQYFESDAIFDIDLRAVSNPGIVVASSIRFNCLASCF